jgi:uncharacterized membrane protein
MMTAMMIVIIVLSNSAGDVFITKGMKKVGEISTLNPVELLRVFGQVLTSKDFPLGILCLAVSFFSFLYVLSWAEMSFIVPATSIVYVFSVIGARLFLNEEIDRRRWFGTLFVCLGVALICVP